MENVKPRHILISGGGLFGGGFRRHVSLLCEVLRDADARVTVAATGCRWPAELVDRLRERGVEFSLPPRWLPAALGRTLWPVLAWPLRFGRGGFDVLYLAGQGGRAHAWLRRVVPDTVPMVYHEIVETPEPGSPAAGFCDAADLIVANSRKVADGIAERWPGTPLRVLPFLIDREPTPEPAPRPAVGDRPLRVTYMGRIVEHKRPHELVARWDRLTQAGPLGPAELDLWGSDGGSGLTQQIEKTIEQDGLAGRVRLRGTYTPDRLPRVLADTDLVVLPSLMEGLPLSLIEAMLHGVPIVSTDAGGSRELERAPGVRITTTAWDEFEAALRAAADDLRRGRIDGTELYRWTDARYGVAYASEKWRSFLLGPMPPPGATD